jgi:hypothetical protein
VLVLPPESVLGDELLGDVVLGVELPADEVDCFLAGFFFFGVDFSAGSADATATFDLTDTAASSTGLVPAALLALAVPPLLEDPPLVALPMPKATAKAKRTAASVIPI